MIKARNEKLHMLSPYLSSTFSFYFPIYPPPFLCLLFHPPPFHIFLHFLFSTIHLSSIHPLPSHFSLLFLSINSVFLPIHPPHPQLAFYFITHPLTFLHFFSTISLFSSHLSSTLSICLQFYPPAFHFSQFLILHHPTSPPFHPLPSHIVLCFSLHQLSFPSHLSSTPSTCLLFHHPFSHFSSFFLHHLTFSSHLSSTSSTGHTLPV